MISCLMLWNDAEINSAQICQKIHNLKKLNCNVNKLMLFIQDQNKILYKSTQNCIVLVWGKVIF